MDEPLGGIGRRRFIRLGAMGIVATPFVGSLLAACVTEDAATTSSAGTSAGTVGGTATTAATAGTTTPVVKTLTIGVPALQDSLDLEFPSHIGTVEAQDNVFNSLTYWSREPAGDGTFVPNLEPSEWDLNLLEEVSVAADQVTWTLKVKPGIMSHSGNELTANDLAYALDRHQGLWGVGSFYFLVGSLLPREEKHWTVIDDRTIEITTSQPSPIFRALLTNTAAFGPIDSVESQMHATADDEWASEWMKTDGDKAGYGPYVVDDHRPGERTVFRAFDDFHRGKPDYDVIVHQQIEDTSTRTALLQSGDLDVAYDLTPVELASLADVPGITVDNFETGRSVGMWMLMNHLEAPFDDILVRQALSYAAPYDQIVSGAFGGFASPWRSCVAPAIVGYTEEFWPYGQGEDFEQARTLLEEAGLGEGFEFDLLFNSSVAVDEQIAIAIQTAFRNIDVQVNLENQAAAAFTERLFGKDFQAVLWSDKAITPDVGYALTLYYRSDALVNVMNYVNPRVDELTDTLVSTLDESVRDEAALEAQQVIVEDAPGIFLVAPHWTIARRSEVTGFTPYPARRARFDELVQG